MINQQIFLAKFHENWTLLGGGGGGVGEGVNSIVESADSFPYSPIPDGVFWIRHIWGGRILPAPYNSVISKDMDLKFGMPKKLRIVFSKI